MIHIYGRKTSRSLGDASCAIERNVVSGFTRLDFTCTGNTGDIDSICNQCAIMADIDASTTATGLEIIIKLDTLIA